MLRRSAFPILVCALAALTFSSARGQEPSPEERPIRFVAYNVWNYLDMNRRIDGEMLENAPKPAEEVEALVEMIQLGNPDILGLCEIQPEPYLAELQARLKSEGIDLPHTHFVAAPDGRPRSLALLSRFPIVSSDSQDSLTYRANGETLPHSRGILDATVQVNPDYQLRLIGLHLKSKREVPGLDQGLMRQIEAVMAREHVDKILEADPETNLLVYGDINDTRNQPGPKSIKGQFGTPGYLWEMKLEDSQGFRWTHHWDWEEIYAKIDFVFASQEVRGEIDNNASGILALDQWALASDHRPLLITINPVDQP